MRKLFLNFISSSSKIASVICILSFALVLLGIKPFILISQSMEPAFTKGSLVLINTRTKLSDVRIGNPIAYRADSGTLIFHRLVGENLLQGDANKDPQYVELNEQNFIGTEFFTIPLLGDEVSKLLENRGTIWLMILACFVCSCLPWKSREEVSSNYERYDLLPDPESSRYRVG